MQTTEMLRKQHEKILDIIESMYSFLTSDVISKDSFEVSDLLATLSGKMKSHLTIEDSLLYPPLIHHEDAAVSTKAKRFADETEMFKEGFAEYVHRWQNSLVIQEKPDEFINETKSMFSSISERIKNEDNDLLPLLEKTSGFRKTTEILMEKNNPDFLEKRQHARYQVQYISYIFYGEEQLGASVVDISESGAGVMLPRKISEGEVLKLRVRCGPSIEKIHEIECEAKIVWIDKEETDGMYRTGLQIINISSDDFSKLKSNIHELAGKQDRIGGITITEKRVLIIEDTKALSYIMKFDLEKSGFRTLTAGNGEQGIEIAKKEEPDLILLDIMLPGINGFEVCRRLKADAATKDIPVVILSVKSQNDDILKGLDAGAAAYIVKSAGFEKIYNKVIELIGNPK